MPIAPIAVAVAEDQGPVPLPVCPRPREQTMRWSSRGCEGEPKGNIFPLAGCRLGTRRRSSRRACRPSKSRWGPENRPRHFLPASRCCPPGPSWERDVGPAGPESTGSRPRPVRHRLSPASSKRRPSDSRHADVLFPRPSRSTAPPTASARGRRGSGSSRCRPCGWDR